MNKFDAEYKKQYSHIDGNIVTAKRKIASAIDDSWIYSMHWEPDTWVEQARVDVQKRINEVTEDLNLLKQAKELLNEING